MDPVRKNEKDDEVEKMFDFAINSIYERSQYLPENEDERRGELISILEEFREYKSSIKEEKTLSKRANERIKELFKKAENIFNSIF